MTGTRRSLAIASAFVTLAGCSYQFQPQAVVDGTLATSPDGQLALAVVMDDHDHGLGSPPYFGVMIAAAGVDPLDGQLAVSGGDFSARWIAVDRVRITASCDGLGQIWYEKVRSPMTIANHQITIDLVPNKQCRSGSPK